MPLAQLVQRNGGLLMEWHWDSYYVDGIRRGHIPRPQRAAIVYFGGLAGGGGQGRQPYILFREDDIPSCPDLLFEAGNLHKGDDRDAQSGCVRV